MCAWNAKIAKGCMWDESRGVSLAFCCSQTHTVAFGIKSDSRVPLYSALESAGPAQDGLWILSL